MALLSEGSGDSAVVEFAVTFTPVGGVSVVGGFRSLNVDIPPFGIRNLWERLVQQLFAGMAILPCFLIEDLISSELEMIERVSCPIHLAVLMVMPPASDHGG